MKEMCSLVPKWKDWGRNRACLQGRKIPWTVYIEKRKRENVLWAAAHAYNCNQATPPSTSVYVWTWTLIKYGGIVCIVTKYCSRSLFLTYCSIIWATHGVGGRALCARAVANTANSSRRAFILCAAMRESGRGKKVNWTSSNGLGRLNSFTTELDENAGYCTLSTSLTGQTLWSFVRQVSCVPHTLRVGLRETTPRDAAPRTGMEFWARDGDPYTNWRQRSITKDGEGEDLRVLCVSVYSV